MFPSLVPLGSLHHDQADEINDEGGGRVVKAERGNTWSGCCIHKAAKKASSSVAAVTTIAPTQ